MATATSTSYDEAVCDLGSLDDMPMASVPSGEVTAPAMDVGAFQSLESLEGLHASEEGGEEDDHEDEDEEKEESDEDAQLKEQELYSLLRTGQEAGMAFIPGTRDDEKHSICDEANETRDMKIAAKPASIQGRLHSAIRPATTSISSRRVDVMESHIVDVLGEIEPMPTSTCASLPDGREALRPAPFRRSKMESDGMSCSDTTRVSLRCQAAPGAYAVQSTPPGTARSNATASGIFSAPSSASFDIDMHEDEVRAVMVVDEEVGRNLVVANPIIHPSTNSNLPFADPFGSKDMILRAEPPRPVWKRIMVFLVLLMVVVVLACSFLLVSRKTDETNISSAPPVEKDVIPSTPAPSVTIEQFIMELLPDYTRTELSEEDSPQARAYRWLLDDHKVSSYPEWRLKQRLGLAALYFSTEGDEWANNTNWLSYDHHECMWYSSVISDSLFDGSLLDYSEEIWMEKLKEGACPCCGESNSADKVGAYKNLHLISNLLHGTVPLELYWLTTLESLTLMTNSLEGTISSNLGMLSHLQALNLVSVGLQGSLPTEVGLLTDLKTLILYTNSLTGPVPSEIVSS
jgi:hypothetical protein